VSTGEFELIATIRRRTKKGPGVLVGIGDDAAVLRAPRGKDLLFTTDMLIEGRHFRWKDATPYEAGRKALAVNLSDIAAMGGVPTYALAAVGLPKTRTGVLAKEIYRGMLDLAGKFRVSLVGGDTNRSEKCLLSVALLGEVERGRAVTRSGARVGDALCVSGPLGGSYASKKHLNFTPRVKEARFLARNYSLHAMIDLSDGLASDARHIADESGVGVCLEEVRIPLSRHARNVRQALTEGEDFELLFALPEKEARRLPKGFFRVGRVVPKKDGVKLLKKNGTRTTLKGGFDHFG
jgi:thiamine-monophosphate kinase